MARRPSLSQQIRVLTEEFHDEIRRAFLASIADVADNVILADIVAALEAGDIDRAVRAIGLSEAAFRPLAAALERAFETGGIATGATFPKRLETPMGRAVFRFDIRTSRAEAILRDHAAFMVREAADETKEGLRQAAQRGMVDGRGPQSVALDMVGRMDLRTRRRSGGIIGLTDYQEGWVRNTRRDLNEINQMIRDGATELDVKAHRYFSRELRGANYDRVIEAAARARKPLPIDTVEKFVDQYKSNALRYRGEMIGRTEAQWALGMSKHEAINQAVDMGAVKASQVRRVWDSTGNDGRTRPTHLMMEGQSRGLNEPFTFPDGKHAMFPGDRSLGAHARETIACRCNERIDIDWLAGARDAMSEQERVALLSLSDAELFGGR